MTGELGNSLAKDYELHAQEGLRPALFLLFKAPAPPFSNNLVHLIV